MGTITAKDALKSPGVRALMRSLQRRGEQWQPDNRQTADLAVVLHLRWVSVRSTGMSRVYSLTEAGQQALDRM
jgi:hypothetical protein